MAFKIAFIAAYSMKGKKSLEQKMQAWKSVPPIAAQAQVLIFRQ